LIINGNDISAINFSTFDYSKDLSKVVIVNCNNSKCSQTSGIIKDNNNFFYIKSDGNSSANNPVNGSCTSNVGLLITQTVNNVPNTYVLCLSESKFIPFTSTTDKYLMDATSGSVPMTVASGKVGVVTVNANYFALDNLYTSKYPILKFLLCIYK